MGVMQKTSPEETDMEQKKTEHNRFQPKQSTNRQEQTDTEGETGKRTSSLRTSIPVLEEAAAGGQPSKQV